MNCLPKHLNAFHCHSYLKSQCDIGIFQVYVLLLLIKGMCGMLTVIRGSVASLHLMDPLWIVGIPLLAH